MARLTTPKIVASDEKIDEAAGRVKEYYTRKTASGRPYFSGSRFDTIAGDGNPPNAFTSGDLLAITMLGVHVPGDAALQILEKNAEELSRLLGLLPEAQELRTLDETRFAEILDSPTSPGAKIWDLLRGHNGGEKLGVGQTITSKLLARKRPHLIPIWDSKIGRQVEANGTKHFWSGMREMFQDAALIERLEAIHRKSGVLDLPLLRVFDVAVWHSEKFDPWLPELDATAVPGESTGDDRPTFDPDEEPANA